MFSPEIKVSDLNRMNKNSILEQLGIEFTEIGEDFLRAKMPVDHRTQQPFGILHGGASVVLAETLGSVASHTTIDTSKQFCVGLEVNANHIKAMREGWVYGTVRSLHMGKKTHVWEIRITDKEDQLVSISRLTMAIIDKK